MRLPSESSQAKAVNYLYFAFLFVFLAILHGFHVFLVEGESLFASSLFLAHVVAQCLVEVAVFMLIWRLLPRQLRAVFVFLTFAIFFLHILDFPFTRLMSMSIWYILGWVVEETSENFFEMLYASNISILMWILAAVATVLILYSGVLLYRFTDRKVQKKPRFLRRRSLLIPIASALTLLALLGLTTRFSLPSTEVQKYQATLPWKSSFFPQPLNSLPCSAALKDFKKEKELLPELKGSAIVPKQTPNIFLFIAESLREDFVTPEIAPNLWAFKNEQISFDLALSSANGTHLSWFSLFHSKYPLYWGKVSNGKWTSGSPALRILKQIGYKVHVYSASHLGYYEMDKILFGKNGELVDAFYSVPHDDSIPRHVNDSQIIDKLCTDLSTMENKQGNLFIIFLDSTHHDYSWPQEQTLFQPIEKKLNYLKAACQNSHVEGIKNRYKNAFYFIDSLFGKCMTRLKETQLWDGSLVVFTGDHGEEFFENGYLFHASSLTRPQTHVPLYYKFGKEHPVIQAKTTTHMDIFPTLFHYIFEEEPFCKTFQGQSIFNHNRHPFTVMGRYNACRTPNEFSIYNGKYKLVAKFSNGQRPYKSRSLQLLSIQDNQDKQVEYSQEFLKSEFGEGLDLLFRPL